MRHANDPKNRAGLPDAAHRIRPFGAGCLMSRTFLRHVVAASVMASVLALPVWARQQAGVSAWTPREFTGGSLTVTDALRLTLENQPAITLATEDVAVARGYLLEQQGVFDTVFAGRLDLNYSRSELGPAALEGERNKRQTIRTTAERFGARLDLIRGQIATISAADPDNFAFDTDDPYLLSIQNSVQTFNALMAAAQNEEDRERIRAIRDAFIAGQLAQLEEQRIQFADLEREQLQQLRNMGAVPTLVEDFFGETEVSLLFPLRSGLSLQPYFRLDGSGSRFVGKDLEFDRGGPGRLDFYNSEIGFNVNLPLGRGGGWESNTALERAAEIDVDASRDALVHAASVSTVETLVTYWDLVAAQRRADTARESMRLQTELSGLTRQLVEGDELPRTELPRSDAGLSASRASLVGIEQGLREARVRLARVIGMSLSDLESAPTAVTDFPDVADPSIVESIPERTLTAAALERRRDVLAARRLEESGRVLAEAARLNLRPIFDVSGGMSYTGLAEDSSITGGIASAVQDWTGPSLRLSAVYERPIGNRTQRGIYQQQLARLSQREIIADDLARVIESNIVETLATLSEAARRVELAEQTVRFYRASLDAEFERFRLGDATLLDTLITEQRLTDASFAMIDARYAYAVLLSRLLYETGSIVEEDAGGMRIREASLLALPVAE